MESPSHQLRRGRLFIHGRLPDAVMGGQLYCRIRAVEDDLVQYETIYHGEDGSQRIPTPSWRPLDVFLELVFGHWY